MAQKIKGITIEIGGDTTNLNKALEDVNKKSKELQSELKGVNSLLKLDPSNVTLLKQKQDVLNESIANTEAKLKTLKDAQVQVQAQFEKNEITAEQYRDFQREIISTETKLKSLTKQLEEFGSVGAQQIAVVGEKMKDTGSKVENAGKKMLGATAVIGGLGTASVMAGANFDDAMKRVAATMGITADEINNGSEAYKILEDAAKKSGETTKFSASESAEALNYLALAGYDARKSVETLPKVLNLAAAGGLDLATASDMVTDAMAALGMETSELDKYIDEMAKTSQKSNTSVSQLGEATLACAGTVKMSGMSLETMNAELGILANNGIKGAEGGTHLRNIILSLTSPTDTATAALKELGISVLDSSGNVRDLNDIMSDFDKELSGLSDGKKTEIISTIFNKTDISAVNALIKGSGEEFANLKAEISNCDGVAQDMADTMNSSLGGQMTLLKSQIESIGIKLSSILMPIISKVISAISKFVDWLSNLNPVVQKVVVVILGLVAALGPLLIIVGKVISSIGKIMETGPKLISLFGNVKKAFTALNTAFATNHITLVVAAVAALVAGFVLLWNNCEDFRNFWINLWEKIKKVCSDVINAITGFFQGVIDFIKNNWQSLLLFIVNPFVGAFKLLYDNCDAFKQFIDNLIQKIKDVISAIVSFMNDKIIEPIKSLFAPLVKWFSDLFTSIYNSLKSVIDVIWGIIQGLWLLITTLFSKALSWFNDNVINPIRESFDTAIEFVKTAFQTAWDFVKSIFSTVANWINDNVLTPIKNFFSSAFNWLNDNIVIPIKNIFDNAWETIKTGASNAWEGIKEVFSNVATFFGNIFTEAWNKVKSVFSTGGKIFDGIKDGISDVFRNVVNKIISGINTVVSIPFNTINGMLNKIRNVSVVGVEPFKKFWKENPLSVPQIPMLRTGGTMIGDGQAIMAEAGSPEMITMMDGKAIVKPLTSRDRKEVMSNNGGDHNTYNFYSPKALTPSECVRKMRKEVQYQKLIHG